MGGILAAAAAGARPARRPVSVAVSQVFPAEVRLSFVAIGLVTSTLTGALAGLAPASAAATGTIPARAAHVWLEVGVRGRLVLPRGGER